MISHHHNHLILNLWGLPFRHPTQKLTREREDKKLWTYCISVYVEEQEMIVNSVCVQLSPCIFNVLKKACFHPCVRSENTTSILPMQFTRKTIWKHRWSTDGAGKTIPGKGIYKPIDRYKPCRLILFQTHWKRITTKIWPHKFYKREITTHLPQKQRILIKS